MMDSAFSVCFTHPDFLVLNKAPGIGIHDEEGEPGLINLARQQLGLELYPVHRLDKVTSGLLLVARHKAANQALSQAFAQRLVKKQYLAISDHKPKKKQGLIQGDMAKGRRGAWLLTRTLENPAITRFTSLSLGTGRRLFFLNPLTGKTHQLRVAMKSLGAPILGDALYGGSPADRVYLHAWRISFPYAGQDWQFEVAPGPGEGFAQLPADWILAAPAG
ncbi:TIGR01621 family pseudouridine synthase [Pseudaeromonas paramecii]|uniref:TIGR01621 family pseudouridine synthase n=1 Tax=Pseudaeromonas paramecii TaxID=2138166 RepID=A0ABP8Q350_9GAMM